LCIKYKYYINQISGRFAELKPLLNFSRWHSLSLRPISSQYYFSSTLNKCGEKVKQKIHSTQWASDIRSKWRRSLPLAIYTPHESISRYKSPALHTKSLHPLHYIHLSLFSFLHPPPQIATATGGEVNICPRSDPAARWPFYRSICREPNLIWSLALSLSSSLIILTAGWLRVLCHISYIARRSLFFAFWL